MEGRIYPDEWARPEAFSPQTFGSVGVIAALLFVVAGRIALLIGNRVPWLSR
jgi:hypothetical protein